jgi:hypothetical protein
VSEASQRRETKRGRRGPSGCGGGCASVIVVLTIGLLLSLFNTAVGIGLSVRVPFTGSNITLAGSVGQKDKVDSTLPGYVQDRLAGNQNFINQTSTLTIWVAEGAAMVVVGHQEGSPAIDLHLEAR